MFGMGIFDDPFFQDPHQQQQQRMQSMFRDPFSPFLDRSHGQQQQQQHQRSLTNVNNSNARSRSSDPFAQQMSLFGRGGGSFDPFQHMNHVMRNMNQMFDNSSRQMQMSGFENGNDTGSFFSQSTVMSYTNDGSGQPKIYQSSTSTKQGPGGVRETRKTVRDTEKGIEKIALGHHIGDKSHIREKKKNFKTREVEENKELINLDESEEEKFENEFKSRISKPMKNSRHNHHLALENKPYTRQ